MAVRRASAPRKLDAGSIDDATGEGTMGTAGERAGGRPQAARGGPDPRRLQAAVDIVVERMRPGQIILFGSGARREMSEGSDPGPAWWSPDAAGERRTPMSAGGAK